MYQTLNENHLFEPVEVKSSEKKTTGEITIEPTQTFQEIDGFGASFTDSAAYLIDNKLSESSKQELMKQLFDEKDGIGLSVIRNPMGASDYARTIYSYNDLPDGEEDLELEQFSISHDLESILPLTKWAQKLNSNLKLFASPWSPPGWMKTSGIMNGGKLKKEYYDVYARYFASFIKEYKKHGLDVYAITPQNEALFMPLHYPSMEFLAHEEADFIKNYLKPTFEKESIGTKILAYDHNWDRIDYAFDVLDEAFDSVDGIAWHWYGGRPVSQSRVQNEFPTKEMHFTEGSGGEWIPAFEPGFSNLMRTGINIMRNHSKSFVLWNMALDENNGPTVPEFGKSTCRGLVLINQETEELSYTLDFYGLAHFSKFVFFGAKRIASNESGVTKNVSFLNTDGSITSIFFNDGDEEEVINVKIGKTEMINLEIAPKSAVTLVMTSD